MKTVFILIVIFIASCSGSPSKNDEDILVDNDTNINDEEASDEDIEHTPACINEWEKTEIVEDVSELFDFDVKVETGKWKWEKKDRHEELVYGADPSMPLGVMNDGSLVLGESFETENGHSIVSILNPDGTFKRYVLEIEKGNEINYGQGELSANGFEPFNFWPGYSFDEERQEILIPVTIRSKIKIPGSEDEYFGRPFLIKIDAQGNLSYIAWKNNGNSVCNHLVQTDDKIIMMCLHWSSDLDIYVATGKINAEINLIYKGNVYRKLMQSDSYASMGPFLSYENGKVYAHYREEYSNSYDPGFVYNVDELDMCVKSNRPDDFFDKLAFEGSPYEGDDMIYPSAFLKKGEYSIIGGMRQRWEHDYDKNHNWLAHYSTLYFDHPEKDTIFTFGMRYPYFEMGGEGYLHTNYFVNMCPKKDSNIVFLSLATTFDMEDKGREWITPELLEKTNWPFQPSIIAIDMETKEAYIKHFFIDEVTGNHGGVFYFGDYLYLLVLYVTQTEPEYVFKRILYRFPESWLINEESKAKDTRMWIEDPEEIKEPQEKGLAELNPFLSVSAGGQHTCSLDEKNSPICWGDNSQGQLGNSFEVVTNSYPYFINVKGYLNGKKVNVIKSGYSHVCAVTDDYKAYCWGDNSSGALGNGGDVGSGEFEYYPSPVNTDGILKDKKITDVASGSIHTCVIDVEGKGYCWGRNTLGSLGTETESQVVPEPVSVDMSGVLKDKKILEISSGSGHTCVVADDGGVYCWGSNGRGQLGDGNGGNEGSLTELGDFSIVPVKSETAEGKYVKVSAGYSHTCILSEAGKIFCFGDNKNGQLGDGTTEMRLTPVALNSDKVFKSVSAGFEHTCAIDDKDEAYCWGGNIVGQLGTGTKESSLTPVKVKYETDSKIKSVSCGHRHTCSVTTEGIVHCWGLNTSGQLGNGTYEDSLTPKEIKTKE